MAGKTLPRVFTGKEGTCGSPVPASASSHGCDRHTLPVGTARGAAGHTQPPLSVAAVAISSPPLECKSFGVGFFYVYWPYLPAARSREERACPGAADVVLLPLEVGMPIAGDAKPWCLQPGSCPPLSPACTPFPALRDPSEGCRCQPRPLSSQAVGTQLASAAPFPRAPLLAAAGRRHPLCWCCQVSGSPRAVPGCTGRSLDRGVRCFTSPHLGRGRRAGPDEAALVT